MRLNDFLQHTSYFVKKAVYCMTDVKKMS